MTGGVVGIIVAAIVALGGGAGLGAILNARRIGRKITLEGNAIGAKTPVEVESISVATMRVAMESSQAQVRELREAGIERDARHDAERQAWAVEKATMRAEFDALEEKLRVALDELLALRQKHNMDEA